MRLNPKPIRVFSRDEECTKVDLHNCFYLDGTSPVRRAVVEARGEIGVNAIKYLKKKDYAEQYEAEGVDWWELTEEGQEWLKSGLARHLELHPEDAGKVTRAPGRNTSARKRRTR